MLCPHCTVAFHDRFFDFALDYVSMRVVWQNCPECRSPIVLLERVVTSSDGIPSKIRSTAWPQHAVRPVPEAVDDAGVRQDFIEACAVLDASPKASAALSRRLLQHIIREKAGIRKRSLSDEIDELIDTGQLSAGLADELHAVRQVGNFAAHPSKDVETGIVVDVEPEEAEWMLDLLEQMLDHFYVQTRAREERRRRLNEKLKALGKPLLPEPSTPDAGSSD